MQTVMHVMHAASVAHSLYIAHTIREVLVPGGPQPIGGEGGTSADVHLIVNLLHDIVATIAAILFSLGALMVVIVGANIIFKGPNMSPDARAGEVRKLVTIGYGLGIVVGAGLLMQILTTLLTAIGGTPVQ